MPAFATPPPHRPNRATFWRDSIYYARVDGLPAKTDSAAALAATAGYQQDAVGYSHIRVTAFNQANWDSGANAGYFVDTLPAGTRAADWYRTWDENARFTNPAVLQGRQHIYFSNLRQQMAVKQLNPFLANYGGYTFGTFGDRHAICWCEEDRELFECIGYSGFSAACQHAVTWDLDSYDLPESVGAVVIRIPIGPFFFTYQDLLDCGADGDLGHMLGVSLVHYKNDLQWPARGTDGTKPDGVVAGEVMRLPASFNVNSLASAPARAFARTLKKYGAMVFDTGGQPKFLTPNEATWPSAFTNEMNGVIQLTALETVDISSIAGEPDSIRIATTAPPPDPVTEPGDTVPQPDTPYPIPAGAIYMAPNGIDGTGRGSELLPCRTLFGNGGAYSKVPSGGTIVVKGGVYEEGFVNDGGGTTLRTKPCTIQAAHNEQVWFDGSIAVTGWSQVGAVWTKGGWTFNAGNTSAFSSDKPSSTFYFNQCFIDGVPQTCVAGTPTAGQFSINHTTGVVTLGSDPTGKEVRLSQYRTLMINSAKIDLLSIGVRRYANGGRSTNTAAGATNGYECVYYGGSSAGSIIRNCAFVDHAMCGLSIAKAGFIVEDNVFVRAGRSHAQIGGSTGCDGLVYNRNYHRGSNRGRFPAEPTAGAVKIVKGDQITVMDNEFHDHPDGHMLWFDQTCTRPKIAGNRCYSTAGRESKTGILWEISGGGLFNGTQHWGYIVDNEMFGWYSYAAMTVLDCEWTKIWENYAEQGDDATFMIRQDSRPNELTNEVLTTSYHYGAVSFLTNHIEFCNNDIGEGNGFGQVYVWQQADAGLESAGVVGDTMVSKFSGNWFKTPRGVRPPSTNTRACVWGLTPTTQQAYDLIPFDAGASALDRRTLFDTNNWANFQGATPPAANVREPIPPDVQAVRDQLAAVRGGGGSPTAVPPTAVPQWEPSGAGSAVAVDATASFAGDAAIIAYSWNWGDGTSNGSGATASHTYAAAGTYTITLTVTASDGSTDVSSFVAKVPHAPDAIATVSATSGVAPFTATFGGGGSVDPLGYPIASYEWDFGDGTTGEGETVEHTYTAAGTYTATLTVTSDDTLAFGELFILGDSMSSLRPADLAFASGGRWGELLIANGYVARQINGSSPGATTEWWRDAIPPGINNGPIHQWQSEPTVTPQASDLVVIFFGANDVNTGVPSLADDLAIDGLTPVTSAEYEANLGWFLENYPGARQVVVYPWRWIGGFGAPDIPVTEGVYLEYRDAAASAADTAGATFVDLGTLLPNASAYIADVIHPNGLGHDFIANAIMNALA